MRVVTVGTLGALLVERDGGLCLHFRLPFLPVKVDVLDPFHRWGVNAVRCDSCNFRH